MEHLVVVRFASDLPDDYLPGIRDGLIVHFHDLELLSQHPIRPAIALPTGQMERCAGRVLPVYEIHPLGPVEQP
jgi:hypothetical protein